MQWKGSIGSASQSLICGRCVLVQCAFKCCGLMSWCYFNLWGVRGVSERGQKHGHISSPPTRDTRDGVARFCRRRGNHCCFLDRSINGGHWSEHLERICLFLIVCSAGNPGLQSGNHTAIPQVTSAENQRGGMESMHMQLLSGTINV